MSHAPVRTASLARHRDAVPRAFSCASTSRATPSVCVHVHVAGELDIAAVAQLAPMLHDAQAQAPLVILDLRDLTFMDSAGVHAIVNASSAARELGNRLVLLRAPEHVDRVFRLTETRALVDTQADVYDPAADRHRREHVQAA